MDGYSQRVVVNSNVFRWMPLLFTVFISDVDVGLSASSASFLLTPR